MIYEFAFSYFREKTKMKTGMYQTFFARSPADLNSTDECFALQSTLSRGYYRFTSDRRYVIDPKPPWLLLFEGSLRNRWCQFSLECVRWCPGFYFKEWKSFFHRFFDRNHPFPSTLTAEHSLISFYESHSCYFAIPKESFCIFYSMRIGS